MKEPCHKIYHTHLHHLINQYNINFLPFAFVADFFVETIIHMRIISTSTYANISINIAILTFGTCMQQLDGLPTQLTVVRWSSTKVIKLYIWL